MTIEQMQMENASVNMAEAVYLYLPDTASLFLDRSMRFQHLAQGHKLGSYLRFMAVVAMAQHQSLMTMSLPGAAWADSGPPLAPAGLALDGAWRSALKAIVDKTLSMTPESLQAEMRKLVQMPDGELDALARPYLAGDYAEEHLALMPIVGSALQVYWAALTQRLADDQGLPGRHGPSPNTCPVCGSLPIGSVVRSGASSQGLRYLACSLCPAQWNMERIRCVHCGDNAKIFYYSIDGQDINGQNQAVQAETCDACHSYAKIMHMEKQPELDVIADDLATMPLDVLVNEAGYQRYGLNPFLLTSS